MNRLTIITTVACLVSPLVMADTLRVTIAGIKAGQGNLRVGVFNDSTKDEWPEGKHLYGVDIPAIASEMTVAIPFVDPGEYAVVVTQDLNQNKQLDRNILRIPTEPYGFSGDWKSGSASFEKAVFDTNEVGYEITIEM